MSAITHNNGSGSDKRSLVLQINALLMCQDGKRMCVCVCMCVWGGGVVVNARGLWCMLLQPPSKFVNYTSIVLNLLSGCSMTYKANFWLLSTGNPVFKRQQGRGRRLLDWMERQARDKVYSVCCVISGMRNGECGSKKGNDRKMEGEAPIRETNYVFEKFVSITKHFQCIKTTIKSEHQQLSSSQDLSLYIEFSVLFLA